jgi:hypothetical protein
MIARLSGECFVGALPDDFQSFGEHGQILVIDGRSQ